MTVNKAIAESQDKIKSAPYYIAVDDAARSKFLNQKFKGFVKDKEKKFPKSLGAEHPFSFEEAEKVLTHVGVVSGAINKIKEAIVGDFSVSSENENVDALVKDFVKNTNFTSVLREWIKEGLSKGNGFMEIDLKEQRVQVLNANNMFVKRDKHGNIKKYNQFVGKSFTGGKVSKDQVVEFKVNEMAHLKLNKIANNAYGIGWLYPNERVIENLIINEQDNARLISRKAGAPIHVKVGQPGEVVDTGAIDAFSNSLKYMNNSTEWVTDPNVDMKLIDFGGINDNILKALDHDMEMLSAGMEIPMVLFGKANIPEGLANVQLEAFQRKIASIREEIETIVVNTIFKPLLQSQSNTTKKVKGFKPQVSEGLQGNINFLWNLPGEQEKNNRLEKLNNILQNFAIDETMRRAIQLEIARILDLEGMDELLPDPKDADDDEAAAIKTGQDTEENKDKENPDKQKERDIKQPEVPGAKPTAKASNKVKIREKNAKVEDKLKEHLTIDEARDMSIREYINLTELEGFNYSDYLIKILQRLKIDPFTDLTALNEKDLELGLFSKLEIEKMRIVLRDGFRRNKTIREIENELNRNLDIQDRFVDKDGDKVLSVTKENRPNLIARSETVRLSNMGLKDLYQENDVTEYQYLAAVDDRTSDICMSLNGRIFKTEDGQPGENMPPMHPNCRSTIVGVVK